MSDAHSAGTNLQRSVGQKEFSRRILHFCFNDTQQTSAIERIRILLELHRTRTDRKQPAPNPSSQIESDQTARCISQ